MLSKKILVAHDFSHASDRAFSLALELAKALKGSVDVVHVHPDVYDGHSDPSLGLPWPMPDQEARYLRFLETELERAVRSVAGEEEDIPVRRHVARGEPVKRILSLAQELGADIVCIGSTGKGAVQRALLGSVSQRVLRTWPGTVLTVH